MIFTIYELILGIFILYSIIIMLPFIIGIVFRKDKLILSQNKKNANYAILIPAREESNVIENLLISIEKQTKHIDSKSVFIIVESEKDKTVSIASKHNMNIIYRKDLSKKRKGYALDDAIKEIISKKLSFDAYFIIDADNVLDKNFLKEMDISYKEGYDICLGYRNCKNGNSSVLAASTALIFSLINSFYNKEKSKHNLTLTVSGTGFFVKGKILENLGGFPFMTLTEDYELSLYANIHSLATNYNDKAVFYDEQPIKYNQSKEQRVRWIKGYIEARKKYISILKSNLKINKKNSNSNLLEIIGIHPLVSMIIGIVVYIVFLLINIIYNIFINVSCISLILKLIILLLAIYIILFTLTIILLIKERNCLNLSLKMKIKVLFYNPLYLITYIQCALIAILKKNIEWKKIEHITKEVK